jgi:hypothetical protein
MDDKTKAEQDFLAQRRARRIWQQAYCAALRGGIGGLHGDTIGAATRAADHAVATQRARFPLLNIA